jgi:L-lactate dehydrogenase (cytochrome)
VFHNLEFIPRVLHDVSRIDTSVSVMGRRWELPFAFAPTGFTRMMHHEGEAAVARVAQDAGIPFALSTMGTLSPEQVKEAAPVGQKWFQLYLWKDRQASRDLVARAAEAGFDTLVLTVDTPTAGMRLRDARNGMTIPPQLTLRTLADMSRHPHWWFNLLTTEPLEFAALSSWAGTVAELADHVFDPSAGLDDLEWLRSAWSGSLIVKGIQSVGDARAVVARGADAVVLSNHGGRQLDRAPTPLHLLPEVVEALSGRAAILVDTGIMNGADVLAAVALGADGCLVGRAYLYGLMAGGQSGVVRATQILEAELVRAMRLLGVRNLGELTPDMVRSRP